MTRAALPILVAALSGSVVPTTQVHGQDYLPNSIPRTYHLHRGSVYQTGCWGPCDCPLDEEVPMRGTFILGLITVGNATDFYSVAGIDWQVARLHGLPFNRSISGMGTFAAGQVPFATHQFMQLDLSISPPTNLWGNVVHFDSLGDARTIAPPVVDIEIANDPDGCPASLRMHLRASWYRSDWNGNGAITIQDLFDFLADFFAGEGDHDLSGTTSVQDVFRFLEDWFGGV